MKQLVLLALVTVLGCGGGGGASSNPDAKAGGSDAALPADAADDPTLKTFVLSTGGQPITDPLNVPIAGDEHNYTLSVGIAVSQVELAVTPNDPNATVTINTGSFANGVPSSAIPLALGDNTITIVITAPSQASLVYTIVLTRASALGFVTAGGVAATSPYDTSSGYAIAVSGDTMAIGVPGDSTGGSGINNMQANNALPDSGAVYVFQRGNSGWAQQAFIKAAAAGSNDELGTSVALDGDTLVVGADNDSSSATGVNGVGSAGAAPSSGAAYVFARTGTTWTQQAYLKASNTGTGDQFGWRVAVAADTIVVGANEEASNATGINGTQTNDSDENAGAAYVFTRAGTIWTQQAYLKASNTQPEQEFGWGVAISGDTIAVSAPGDSSNATGVNGDDTNTSIASEGAVFVFARTGTTWTQEAYVKPSHAAAMLFGEGLGLSANTLVVGAPNEASGSTGIGGDQTSSGAAASGAAFVFTRTGTTWTQQEYLKASNTGANELFGYSAAVSGDAIVVGAYRENSGATGIDGNQADTTAPASGAAYVFTRQGATWSQLAYLKSQTTSTNARYGFCVAISEDNIVVGSPEQLPDGNAYLYH